MTFDHLCCFNHLISFLISWAGYFDPNSNTNKETGSEKMIYQWNNDLNIVTQQTEESKRVGEILEGLKLGGPVISAVFSLGVSL
jgi:hypothetical protein